MLFLVTDVTHGLFRISNLTARCRRRWLGFDKLSLRPLSLSKGPQAADAAPPIVIGIQWVSSALSRLGESLHLPVRRRCVTLAAK